MIGIGDDPVARPQGALRRLDQAVDVVEAFRLGDAQTGKQREDHQRSDALGRRIGVVDRARGQLDLERFGDGGVIACQIVVRERAADARQIGRDLTPDIAPVEIIEAGAGKVSEGVGERPLPHGRVDGRRLAADQERFGEPRHAFEL